MQSAQQVPALGESKEEAKLQNYSVRNFEGHESTDLTDEQTKELTFIKFGSTYFILEEMFILLPFKDMKMSDYFDFTKKKKV